MVSARLAVLLLLLIITSMYLLPAFKAEAASEDFSKKAAGGATASIFLFLLPKVAEDSAKAVGKTASDEAALRESSGRSRARSAAMQAAASLYNESKEAMACLYNETKQAVACLYNETIMHAVAFLYNESKQAGRTTCPPSCFRPNPVCGTDGVTYWCGLADAECAGVEVAHIGYCDFGSRDTGSKGVLAVQSLLLVHMIWLMLAAFLVLLGGP